MEFKPHSYQKRAISFMLTHPSCLIALEMGLGKTVCTLKVVSQLLDDFEVHRVLIIAPKFVALDTWGREISKWDFSRTLSYNIAVGTAQQRCRAVETPSDILITSRDNVKWLVENYGRRKKTWDFDCVVIDESSSFKNPSSERFKAMKKVKKYISRMILLTGTPEPRSILDLMPQMYLIDGGERLGRTVTEFRERWMTTGRVVGRDHTGKLIYLYEPRAGAAEKIYQKIADVAVSMKAEDWLEVPPLREVVNRFSLTKPLQTRYDTFAEEMVEESIKIAPDDEFGSQSLKAGSKAELIGKLAQFASGAIYINDQGVVSEIHQLKIDALKEILDCTEDNVMVLYWYKHSRERIIEALGDKYGTVDEITDAESIKRWNDGKTRVLLAQSASIGYGLNLQQGGHTMVWFDPIWNLELYQQTVARLHRQGQQNPVVMHTIVAADTVDEMILKALEIKGDNQEALLQMIKDRVELQKGKVTKHGNI